MVSTQSGHYGRGTTSNMAATIRRLGTFADFLSIFRKSKYCELCHKPSDFSRIHSLSINSNRQQHFAVIPQNSQLVNKLAQHRSACRAYTSDQSQDSQPASANPYKLVESELASLCDDINKELSVVKDELGDISQYHFDGQGKTFRPMLVMLMAKAVNLHTSQESLLLPGQRSIALIAEMIHTASLIHDDVIDESQTRRGRPSVHSSWGQRKAILAGDYILSVASQMLARIRNEQVIIVLSQVLEDLVRGEFMQLGSKEDENERFAHYLKKTFKKTASLLANSCKAVSILTDCSEEMVEAAFQYGRNLGIAFQLVDDVLDFVSSEQMMGKPTAADLQLGLATAPVLFAAQQYPELNPMIMRRFNETGDVITARRLVALSDGVAQTRILAEQHCKEAVRQLSLCRPSIERDALEQVTHLVLNRTK